jgi:hypothetical protein
MLHMPCYNAALLLSTNSYKSCRFCCTSGRFVRRSFTCSSTKKETHVHVLIVTHSMYQLSTERCSISSLCLHSNGTAAVITSRGVEFWPYLCMPDARHYLPLRTPDECMLPKGLNCYCMPPNLHTWAKSSSAYTVVGSCSHVASTSANGPTTVEWPHAW